MVLVYASLTPSVPYTVLALSKRNSNAAEVIIFLHRLSSVLIEYFKELEEESIRDNFVIIYELLDEMMDYGFPQSTESKNLQECVLTSTYTGTIAFIGMSRDEKNIEVKVS